MTLKRYWDLSGSERAALSEQDVTRLCDLELMVEGVLKPEPMNLLPEEPVPIPTRELYGIQVSDEYSRKETLNLLFVDEDEARHVLSQGAFVRVQEYGKPEYYRQAPEAVVIPVRLPGQNQVSASTAALDKARLAKEHNAAERARFKKETDAIDKAVSSVWRDYHEQCRLLARVQQVARVWETYLAMSNGDRQTARKFLDKAFPPEFWDCRGQDVDLVHEAIGDLGAADTAVPMTEEC